MTPVHDGGAPGKPGSAPVPPALALDGVSFSYGGATVLARVSLRVAAGELVAVIGPNGAGKTTLVKIAAGLLRPSEGRVRVADLARGAVAYLAQADPLPAEFTVAEVVELGRLPHTGIFGGGSPRDRRSVTNALSRTGLTGFAGRTLATLSGGERQRVALARALAQEPRVLLLDEPASHLDARGQVDLFTTLRTLARDGTAIVAVVHDLSFAALADRCVLLAGGATRADGTPRAVLRAETLSSAYGTPMEVITLNDGRIVALPKVAVASASSPRSRAFVTEEEA